MLKVSCPQCSEKLFFDPSYQLTEQNCSHCRSSFTIPKPFASYTLQKKYANDSFSESFLALNSKGKNCLFQLFNSVTSQNPKQLELIKHIIGDSSQQNNITKTIASKTTPDETWIEFELEGHSLKKHLKDENLSQHDKLNLIKLIATELLALHTKSLTHDNLKPSTIKITKAQEIYFHDIKLSTALEIQKSKDEAHTEWIPNLNYASPESLTSKEVSTQSNLFSLGIICFEILTGKSPYPQSNTISERITTIEDTSHIHLEELLSELKPELKNTVLALLKNDAKQRPSIQELLKALSPKQPIDTISSSSESEKPIFVHEPVAMAAPKASLDLLLDKPNEANELIDLISDPVSAKASKKKKTAPDPRKQARSQATREVNKQIQKSATRIKVFFIILNMLIFGCAISYMFFYSETRAFINDLFKKEILPAKSSVRKTIE